jgi:hypothetical protein
MTNELREALELAQPFLEKAGQAVEGGAKFSYEVLLRQQYVRVAQVGLGWLFFLLLIVAPTVWALKKEEEALVLLLGLVGLFFLAILVVYTFEIVGILINPNYYVIQEVVNLLGAGR